MIRLEDLTVGYGSRVLIENACCDMKAGRLVAMLGRNGAGKSTLLRALAGLSAPQQGRILVDGKDLARISAPDKSRLIAFVTTERVRIADLRCRDVVALGRAPYTNWIGRLDPADEKIVADSLAAVGMSDYADRTMDKMSDGECQRVMIARALAQDTPVILLDEPTSYLDLPNRYELGMLLQRLAHDRRKCVIFSTHELDIAMSLCDDIALIDSPRLLFETPTSLRASGILQRVFRLPIAIDNLAANTHLSLNIFKPDTTK